MHFHKYPYHPNFEFASRVSSRGRIQTRLGPASLQLTGSGDGLYHLRIRAKGWERNESIAGLPSWRRLTSSEHERLELTSTGTLIWRTMTGETLLESQVGRFFGRCGPASIFEFLREDGDQFYGMGEKWSGLEHTGKRTKFWNTDVWADFHSRSCVDLTPAPDPVYLSIPYLILHRRGRYLGLLLDNPYATFIATGARVSIGNQMDLDAPGARGIHLGAEQGQPNLYFVYGPSLPELTRRLQRLVGRTPRPPLWALGYHQCRWGYRSADDLRRLDRSFRRHRIPVDGLWLDIDYMDRFKVFTFSKQHFPDPEGLLKELAERGRRVIPVIDPGVKREPGYDVYERGRTARAFCQNPGRSEFVGLVWPGDSVFPDFSRDDACTWWTREMRDFARAGINGVWIDMNDPSTGPVDNAEMLFDRGRLPHAAFHNQYALGMAAATRAGLLAAHPDQRPFVLSRSGFIGSQRHTAVWTGDNYSNYQHLRACIATSLNLALSGIPFNAPDVGGFGGDCSGPLLRDWFKCCFLFPFLRNHTCAGTRQQEPWAFDPHTLSVARHYIRLRYKLLPYLYQLFVEHERSGEAILRPLFHDFSDTPRQRLGRIDDEFMVGPAILQAPVVNAGSPLRRVFLPGPAQWWDATTGQWHAGGTRVSAGGRGAFTPLFIRGGTLLPMQCGERRAAENNLADLELHCFVPPGRSCRAVVEYTLDDGATFEYLKGHETRWELQVESDGSRLRFSAKRKSGAAKSIRIRLVIYDAVEEVTAFLGGTEKRLRLRPHGWRFTGNALRARISAPLDLD